MMSGVLNRFYIRFIRPADPGFFISRYAAKAAVCCLAALVAAMALGLRGEALFWWVIGAVCTVLFRTGSTLGRRKRYALILLGASAVTAPLAAVAGGHPWMSLVLIFFLSFVCFLSLPWGCRLPFWGSAVLWCP